MGLDVGFRSSQQYVDRVLRRYDHLTFTNDFVFRKTMTDQAIYHDVLEAVLESPVHIAPEVHDERPFEIFPGIKSIRPDTYARGADGALFTMEMQTSKKRDLLERSDYYHSIFKVSQLKSGDKYDERPKNTVIFLCTFDLLGLGHPIYRYETRCKEVQDNTIEKAGSTLFVCATPHTLRRDGSRLDELLAYIMDNTVAGPLTSRIASKVKSVLSNDRWRLEYMNQFIREDMLCRENRAEGRAEGRSETWKLIDILTKEGRMEDVKKAANDPAYQNELMKAYGLK